MSFKLAVAVARDDPDDESKTTEWLLETVKTNAPNVYDDYINKQNGINGDNDPRSNVRLCLGTCLGACLVECSRDVLYLHAHA